MFQKDKGKNNMSSILGADLEINGNINISGDLLVYGKVNGNITSSGAVNTSEGSLIKGNITSENANISGEIHGDITVKQKVSLNSNAVLIGNLQSSILIIEEGAQFDGISNMNNVKEKSVVDEELVDSNASNSENYDSE